MYLLLSLGHVHFQDGIFVPKHVGVMSVPSCVYNIVIGGGVIAFICPVYLHM